MAAATIRLLESKPAFRVCYWPILLKNSGSKSKRKPSFRRTQIPAVTGCKGRDEIKLDERGYFVTDELLSETSLTGAEVLLGYV
jgi:hypothetical protein